MLLVCDDVKEVEEFLTRADGYMDPERLRTRSANGRTAMDDLDALRARQLDGRLWAVALVEAVAAKDLPGMDALVLDMLEPQPREDQFRGALIALTWLLQDALDEGHPDPAEWLAEQRGRALAHQPPAEPAA